MNCCTYSVSSQQGHPHCSTGIRKREGKGWRERESKEKQSKREMKKNNIRKTQVTTRADV